MYCAFLTYDSVRIEFGALACLLRLVFACGIASHLAVDGTKREKEVSIRVESASSVDAYLFTEAFEESHGEVITRD